MHIVGAALDGEVHERARRVTGLRIEGAGLYLELRDRVRGRGKPDAARVRHVGRPVDRELVAALCAVGDDAREVAVVGRPGKVQIGRVHDSRGEACEHVRGAVAERQLGDLFALDRGAADTGARVEQRSFRGHRHRLGDASGGQGHIYTGDLRHAYLVVEAHEPLEAGDLGSDRVSTWIQVQD